jgi:hypothetical protein
MAVVLPSYALSGVYSCAAEKLSDLHDFLINNLAYPRFR